MQKKKKKSGYGVKRAKRNNRYHQKEIFFPSWLVLNAAERHSIIPNNLVSPYVASFTFAISSMLTIGTVVVVLPNAKRRFHKFYTSVDTPWTWWLFHSLSSILLLYVGDCSKSSSKKQHFIIFRWQELQHSHPHTTLLNAQNPEFVPSSSILPTRSPTSPNTMSHSVFPTSQSYSFPPLFPRQPCSRAPACQLQAPLGSQILFTLALMYQPRHSEHPTLCTSIWKMFCSSSSIQVPSSLSILLRSKAEIPWLLFICLLVG